MSPYRLRFTATAAEDLAALESDRSAAKRLKAVRKALGLIETNLRHPGLHTHKYSQLFGPNGEQVFEAYVENRTPAAFRVFWCTARAKARSQSSQ